MTTIFQKTPFSRGDVIPAANLPAASGSAQGAESAANFTKLATLATGGWEDDQARWLPIVAPGVSRVSCVDYGLSLPAPFAGQSIATLVSDASKDGGAFTSTGDDLWLSPFFVQTPNLVPWAFSLDCVPVNASWQFGIKQNPASVVTLISGGASLNLNTLYTGHDPNSVAATAEVAVDGLRHTLTLAFDPVAATLTLYQDKTQIIQLTDISNVPTAPVRIYVRSAPTFYRLAIAT